MKISKHLISWTQALAISLSLLACSGTSGSGGTIGGAAPAGVGGGNSLDSGGGGSGGGTVGGGDLGAGSQVPGTQQSEPGIGAPCGNYVETLVRVIENGFVRNCDGSLGPAAEYADIVAGNTGTMAMKSLRLDNFDAGATEVYVEPMDYNPKVNLSFFAGEGNFGNKTETKDATCRPDGYWTTGHTCRWGYADGRCADFRLSLTATLRSAGQNYSSATWHGSEFPADSEGNSKPVLLVIDRGRTGP